MNAIRIVAAVAAAAVVLVAAGCSGGQAHQGAAVPAGVPVLVAQATTADVPISLSAIGTVEPYQTVLVKTMVGGELTRAAFREGQEVRRGDLLFTIDSRSYEAELQQARATLARDRALLENARVEEKRNAELVAKEYVTQSDFDRARTTVETLVATVQADEAAVRNAEVELSYCTIRSPIDGRIGKTMVNQGNVVKANDIPLVSINQIRPIRVAYSVPESQLPDIRKHQAAGRLPVQVSPQAAPQDVSTGSLDFLDNSVDRSTGTITLRAVFENKDGALWPGQFVNVKMDLERRPGAIVVPNQAIQTGQQGTYVFVVKPDQTAESRKVKVGPAVGDLTVVDEGLAPGDQVVTDGQLRLVPGARVEVKTGLGAPDRQPAGGKVGVLVPASGPGARA